MERMHVDGTFWTGTNGQPIGIPEGAWKSIMNKLWRRALGTNNIPVQA